MYDINTFQLYSEWRGASKTPTDAIVGLEFAHNRLYSCSVQGRLVIRNLKDHDGEFNYWHSSVKEPVSSFRVHPLQDGIIATGGKDKDLEVMELYDTHPERLSMGESRPHWILQALQADTSLINQRVRIRWQAKTARATKNSHRHFDNTSNLEENDIDQLDQYPVWISGIQFLNLNQPKRLGWRIATTTRYGYINIYETSISRRCVFSILASNYPLVNLWFGGNERELIYTDSQYGVGIFDSVSGELSKMKGEAGSSMVHVHAMYRETRNYNSLIFPDVTETRIGELKREADDSYLEEEFENYINNISSSAAASTMRTTPITTITNNENTTITSPLITKPLLVSGGLDKYLRVYDLEAANMVLKVRVCNKISDLWIIDTANSSLKRQRSPPYGKKAESVSESASEQENQEPESKRIRSDNDVCME